MMKVIHGPNKNDIIAAVEKIANKTGVLEGQGKSCKNEEENTMESKRRLTVTNDCDCCGLCSEKYPNYFFRDIQGYASIKDGVLVLDAEKAAEVQKICPAQAIAVRIETTTREVIADVDVVRKNADEPKMSLTVSNECNCCGMCGVKYPDYFCEDAEGRASVKDGVLMLDAEKAAEVQKICPVHAITAVKEEKNIRQMLSDAVDNLKAYKLAYPTKAEIPFKKEEYFIPTPIASGEHRYDYSSESSANSAARSEFNRQMYSQIDSLILKVITEYRVKYIKPYYSKDETSVYAACNKKLEGVLRGICQILKSEGLAGDLPNDFANVSVFPDENDATWRMLNKGELISDEMVSSIRSEFNSGTYSSLSSYESYWDTDDMEVSAGTGFGGRTKYKDKYCYRNLRSAFQELAKDILSACYYKDDYIVERASDTVKWLIDQYNKKLENLISIRIAYIEKKIGSMRDTGSKEAELQTFSKMMRCVEQNKDGKICVNGNPTDATEMFVVDTEDGKEQFFYDGKVIKKRRVVNGLVKNDIILQDKQPKYFRIIGYNGQILYDADNCLWRYNCQSGTCEKLVENILYLRIYKNILFYTIQDNLKRITSGAGRPGEERMNSSGSIWCRSFDGKEKHQLKSFGYGSGIISIKLINDKEVFYEVSGNKNQEGSVEWRNSWISNPLAKSGVTDTLYTDYGITEECKQEKEKAKIEKSNSEKVWIASLDFGDINQFWDKIVEEVNKDWGKRERIDGGNKKQVLHYLGCSSVVESNAYRSLTPDKDIEEKGMVIGRNLYTEGKLDISVAYKYVMYWLSNNAPLVATFASLYNMMKRREINRWQDILEELFQYSTK